MNMAISKPDNTAGTKERILQTTLNLIQAEGFEGVTVRKIAGLAGVNVAAVNYHFGSKDNVIQQALGLLNGRFGAAFICLQETELPPRQRLLNFIGAYIEVGIQYPYIVRNFINQSMHTRTVRGEYESFVQAGGLAIICRTLGEYLPGDEAELRLRAFQMMSSLALPLSMGDAIAEIVGIRFNDPETRRKYIELLVP